MTQNWRSPIVENRTAVQTKSDSGNDDDDKTLVDGDEEILNIVQLDKLYVFGMKFLSWQDANNCRRLDLVQLLQWL